MPNNLALQRLSAQGLSQPRFNRPAEVVAWLGAVQAQDYPAAKWAVGLRLRGGTDAMVAEAVNRGEVLRTHVMRPTWHFVSPADIRWMLALTAPRVNAALASNYRRLGLDREIFAQADDFLLKTLSGGRQMTRVELVGKMKQAGILTGPSLRALHILLHAELDGIICSGAWRGKQATYALLEERVPPSRPLARDEALPELARRYFTSHGPASLKDFAWWSGLTIADAKAGTAIASAQLMHATISGETYWFSADPPLPAAAHPEAFLLPNYDEYSVGYTDRSAIFDAANLRQLGLRESVVMTHVLVAAGQVVGTWKRTFSKGKVLVSLKPFGNLNEAQAQAFTTAAQRYAEFLSLPLIVCQTM